MPRILFALIILYISPISVAVADSWTPYTDERGDLFLRQSPAIIVEPSGEVIELYRPGSFIRVEFIGGQWIAVPMTQRQWRDFSLIEGHDGLIHLSYEAVGWDGEKRLIILMERDGVQYHLRFNGAGRSISMKSVNLSEEPPYQPPFRIMSGGGASLRTPTDHEATTADFRVDESGAATIQIPIYTPEGIAGVTPSLSLNYNSRGGAGLMGMGWSLNAGGSISRCPQTIAQDGVANGVTFSQSDRLCLNGVRLLGSNQADYWGSSYFVPELDPSSKVHPYKVSGNISAFVVETKAGELHYFGDLNAISGTYSVSSAVPFLARNDALFNTHPTLGSVINNTPKIWAQKATADIVGNYIEYTYTSFETTGEHFLTGIRYSLRANQSPLHEVSIVFGSATARKGWQYGTPLQSTRRIDGVQVSSHGHVVRNYRIDYRLPSLAEEKFFVDGIQECSVNNGIERCKYPVTFDWERPASAALEPIVICDPLSPHICWEEPQQNDWDVFDGQVAYRGSTQNASSQLIMDFTSNGHADIVYVKNGEWRIILGGVAQTRCSGSTIIAGDCYPEGLIGPYTQEESLGTTGANVPSRALTIDYDGSGKRALLVADDNELKWRIRGMRPNQPADNCELEFDSSQCGYL